MLAHIPVGKQGQLPGQQGVVVVGQHAWPGGQLPLNQHIDRAHVKRIHRRSGQGDGANSGRRRDDFHHGARAQVCQQHEAVGAVPVQHPRRVEAGVLHQRGDAGKRRAVLDSGRRVHDDAAAASRCIDAKIAAKAGIS